MTVVRAWWVLLLALAAGGVQGASFEAVVLHVADGDTLRVRPLQGGPPLTLRLEGIDAPD